MKESTPGEENRRKAPAHTAKKRPTLKVIATNLRTLDEAFCPTTHPPGVAGGQGGREAIGAGDHGRRWWGWWEGGREEGK